jgi:hypothetical protein
LIRKYSCLENEDLKNELKNKFNFDDFDFLIKIKNHLKNQKENPKFQFIENQPGNEDEFEKFMRKFSLKR